jgi:hypothetical protein
MGKRMPTTAILNEYAKVDPIYVEKTLVRGLVWMECNCADSHPRLFPICILTIARFRATETAVGEASLLILLKIHHRLPMDLALNPTPHSPYTAESHVDCFEPLELKKARRHSDFLP